MSELFQNKKNYSKLDANRRREQDNRNEKINGTMHHKKDDPERLVSFEQLVLDGGKSYYCTVYQHHYLWDKFYEVKILSSLLSL